MTTHNTHGGDRPNSGRKVGYRKANAKRDNLPPVKVSAEQRSQVVLFGDGNASEGVRRTIAIALARANELGNGDMALGIRRAVAEILGSGGSDK